MRFYPVPSLYLLSTVSALAFKTSPSSTVIPSEPYIQVETDPSGIKWPWRIFRSSPYTPPNMTISGNDKPLAEGYIFMTPQSINATAPAAEGNGGFIMTSAGDLVFARNVSGMTDFRKQYYNGKPYLTYWSGYNTNGANIGHGYGQVRLFRRGVSTSSNFG